MARKKRTKAVNEPAKTPYKSKGSAKKPAKKQRGTLLTVLLVLILVYSAFATWLAYNNLKADFGPSRPWVLPALFLISAADIVAAFAMLYWKKWGIYLYAISRVAAAAIHLMLTGSLLVVFADLLPVSIVAYVIQLQQKDKLFD